jgi:DNA end-binding protein Ku
VAARAIWKGHLSVGELSCAVALYSAATTSERISFHIVNKKTGNRVRREYVDEQTGKPVARDDQVKGYETATRRCRLRPSCPTTRSIRPISTSPIS